MSTRIDLKDVTIDDVITATREVLAERGRDFTYSLPDFEDRPVSIPGISCFYSLDGGQTGSCALGAVLIEKLGVEYELWWEGKNIVNLLESLGLGYGGSDSTAAKVGALGQVQDNQDNLLNYGRVSDDFEEALS